MPGFSAAGETFDEVRELALEGVAFATDTQPDEIVEEKAPKSGPG